MNGNLPALSGKRGVASTAFSEPVRCWQTHDPLVIQYHDEEWGTPLHDDGRLFEILVLETLEEREGLASVLRKRRSCKQLLDLFDPERISAYSMRRVEAILTGSDLLSREELEAVTANAAAFVKVREELGSFSRYIWGFTCGMQVKGECRTPAEIPERTALSDVIALDMKKRGFRIQGSRAAYSYLQAIGVVNDHLVGCFRCSEKVEQFC